jgi:prepilin-type N-terminal cleavage/methylation domain-containing protein
MTDRFRQAGLTLMEVLVAIALLSLLSVSILTALHMGTQAWERTNESLMLDRRIAAANAILHAEIEGIFPAWAVFRNPSTRAPYTFLLFQGEPAAMRFVTAYSLDSGPRGGARLVEMQVARAEKGMRILVNERIYDGPNSASAVVTGLVPDAASNGYRPSFAPIVAQPSSFIIADELAACSFSYLSDSEPDRSPRWMPVWNDAYRLPAAISIQLTPLPDPQDGSTAPKSGRAGALTRLRPVTVTAPVRSTMLP